jgi:hypothetical protein
MHACVQSERNWINRVVKEGSHDIEQAEEDMGCKMTDTRIAPCNTQQNNWIDAVVKAKTHSPSQAERAMNGCARRGGSRHACVQTERNWINRKITDDGWTKLQGEEAMGCEMTDTELVPCNVAQTNWINAVVKDGTHNTAQAQRAMNGCAL